MAVSRDCLQYVQVHPVAWHLLVLKSSGHMGLGIFKHQNWLQKGVNKHHHRVWYSVVGKTKELWDWGPSQTASSHSNKASMRILCAPPAGALLFYRFWLIGQYKAEQISANHFYDEGHPSPCTGLRTTFKKSIRIPLNIPLNFENNKSRTANSFLYRLLIVLFGITCHKDVFVSA
jgi:hypothetical protein